MKNTLIILIIFIILIITCIFIAKLYNYIYDDLDACLDSGVCKEGLILNMNDGKQIIINKDTCKQYNGEWRENYNDCHFMDYNDKWK